MVDLQEHDTIRVILPDREPIPDNFEDYDLIAGWVCEHCFDGLLRTPLADGMKILDQGIDLDFHRAPLKRTHRCTFTQILAQPKSRQRDITLAFARASQRRGKWRATSIVLPQGVKQLILEKWAEPGPPTDTSELRKDRP